jgi:hypothetical protein
VRVVQGSLPLHGTLLEESVVTDYASDLVIQDALKPGNQLPRVLAGELPEAAMRLQKGLLDDIGGVHAHSESPIELSLGYAVQDRPLCLEQSAQRFSIAPPGLLQQHIGLHHRRTPIERTRLQVFLGRGFKKPHAIAHDAEERNRRPSPSMLNKGGPQK